MAESSEVKLLGTWWSPFAMRSRIALNIKHVNYAFVDENLLSKSELLLKSNSVHKKIPVLIHGDKPVCESLIIVQYIDDVWTSDPSILPSDPYDRATALFWAAYLDEKWFPALKGILFGQGEDAKKALVDQAVEALVLVEEAFGKCSKGKPFFGGDQIGYVDIAFGCFLAMIRVTEKFNDIKLLDQAKTPELVKWAERFCQHPAVNGVMPETEELAEYAEIAIVKMRDANPPKS
ncbi:hypothetical protein FNV43_RR26118 [Rhamnella rubrinervis]|uniref:glutathione transferase n=1 Tax=Rhamnella rubrinervis TaxID=2594499 RepID=A0A8K0DI11_9ROSA|nr:hypothetical protein FNV43_RR26118 [Rhamnella rubrinervis]